MKINDNGTDREATKAEEIEHQAAIAETQAQKDALTQAETDRQKLKTATLAKLGLTADEAAALLS